METNDGNMCLTGLKEEKEGIVKKNLKAQVASSYNRHFFTVKISAELKSPQHQCNQSYPTFYSCLWMIHSGKAVIPLVQQRYRLLVQRLAGKCFFH